MGLSQDPDSHQMIHSNFRTLRGHLGRALTIGSVFQTEEFPWRQWWLHEHWGEGIRHIDPRAGDIVSLLQRATIPIESNLPSHLVNGQRRGRFDVYFEQGDVSD